MFDREKSSLSTAFVRIASLLVMIATLSLSAWWLAAEASRGDPDLAARIAMLRGELWLRAATASAGKQDAAGSKAEAAFRRAIELSPMNASAWFGLASIAERFDWRNQGASKALKMSYYTGFNDRDLIAMRLLLLARTDTGGDPELQDLLKQQILLILTRAPELEPAVARAYGAATAANRQIIEAEFRDLGRPPPALYQKPPQ